MVVVYSARCHIIILILLQKMVTYPSEEKRKNMFVLKLVKSINEGKRHIKNLKALDLKNSSLTELKEKI